MARPRTVRLPIDNGDGTCTVTLTKGKVAIIDAADAEAVARHTWCIQGKYAATNMWNPQRLVRLHRFLMDPPEGMEVDHIDGDGLNCRRSNMRIVTRRQNQWNNHGRGVNPYVGICKEGRRWRPVFVDDGTMHWLGTFETPEEAALMRDYVAWSVRGEHAYLNFPDKVRP